MSFVADWRSDDHSAALQVATPAAVATLFANAYSGQTVVARGCSDQFPPLVCTFGPNGGGSGSLYEISVTPTGSAWYVSSVLIES